MSRFIIDSSEEEIEAKEVVNKKKNKKLKQNKNEQKEQSE